ncbi:MAG: D-tyrosyl-tRNA(Tyr) deacylase [Gammaproteobacteria bacterium]|nr:D-tyrosyl-tRNA(Tyr) deacylase [Gammaproteobacteria bacterium]
MICLIQRVSNAYVEVSDERVASIDQGILALLGIQAEDDEKALEHNLGRILNYRIFADENDKMNLSLLDIHGGLLLVPQFTLAANTKKGRRPSFTSAAPPEQSKQLFYRMVDIARDRYDIVESGVFGADMRVYLCNDGPVTFILD